MGAPGSSEPEGLGGDVMSSVGMNGVKKCTPLLAATIVVTVVTITQRAMMEDWAGRAAKHQISASYALQSRFPMRYRMNSRGSVSRALYGGSR